ncbi:GNAT family N-acetyltransferase [Leptothoe sp. PORK10 BA2]|uniref:GNAT family N-acetyltransferase n=1 Tax=Leptothoe sp. PORK10 BA2 TaxID=3110254 RepID=UPI002B1F33E3|nr:N-acetyltransferase [Leptothoe sp. PORK10 BA2]MEA5465979.1 N-acetyltransferase [Leptothoe sp. PORK10 BA2]
MHIRLASLLDRDSIRCLHLSAFPEEEREAVAALAVNLLAEKTTPETFAFVAETDHIVMGHIAFSPVSDINTDKFQGYLLAPLAVHPQFQKQGIGTGLVEAGMQHLLQLAVDIVFVYGSPQYYSRFGFDPGFASEYVPPYQLKYSFGWQAKSLKDGNTFPASAKLSCVPSLRDPQLW